MNSNAATSQDEGESTTTTDEPVKSPLETMGPYSGTAAAALVSLVYGVLAIAPLIEVALLSHPPWLPQLAGAGLGLGVPLAFQSWHSRAQSIKAITFGVVATLLTVGVHWLAFDPIPLVRGSQMALADLALATTGAAALALAVTWYVVADPT